MAADKRTDNVLGDEHDVDHAGFLRYAFDVARTARQDGSHPFGSILVDSSGVVLMTQGNAFLPDHDMTGHAERVLASRACRQYSHDLLLECTLYTSAEPCAMCSGAIYWSGIGRVVYGLAETDLARMTGDHTENPTLNLPCRTVFAAGQRAVEVIGPMLESEAAALHDGAWS